MRLVEFSALAGALKEPAGKKAVVGFDGFVDTIARPVRNLVTGAARHFGSLGEFGEFVASRAGKSGSVELDMEREKPGGNMLNTALALRSLGGNITCVGSLGYPECEPLFLKYLRPEEMVSAAGAGRCIALEFRDGKLMCGLNGEVNTMGWALMKERIGLKKLRALYLGADLAAFLNWSELPMAGQVWKGLLDEVYPGIPAGQWSFFDLSDCGRRSGEEIREICRTISAFSQRTRAVLSLNENEARAVCSAFGLDAPYEPEFVGLSLRRKLGCEIVSFHSRAAAFAFTEEGSFAVENKLIQMPAISTGGGDNLNAGFAAALLCGLSAGLALACGSLCASFYVENGRPATMPELLAYAKT